jgi:hypothetical protein
VICLCVLCPDAVDLSTESLGDCQVTWQKHPNDWHYALHDWLQCRFVDHHVHCHGTSAACTIVANCHERSVVSLALSLSISDSNGIRFQCVFFSFAFAAFTSVEDEETDLRLQKVVFGGINMGALAMGFWKCGKLGLLPLFSSDWMGYLGTRTVRACVRANCLKNSHDAARGVFNWWLTVSVEQLAGAFPKGRRHDSSGVNSPYYTL